MSLIFQKWAVNGSKLDWVAYHRETTTRIPARVEEEIEKELMLEKNLIDDSTLPITGYNYAAIRDRLIKR
jgi:hypothetical protein